MSQNLGLAVYTAPYPYASRTCHLFIDQACAPCLSQEHEPREYSLRQPMISDHTRLHPTSTAWQDLQKHRRWGGRPQHQQARLLRRLDITMIEASEFEKCYRFIPSLLALPKKWPCFSFVLPAQPKRTINQPRDNKFYPCSPAGIPLSSPRRVP